MNEESIAAWIIGAFDRVEHLVKDGTTFISFDPEHMHQGHAGGPWARLGEPDGLGFHDAHALMRHPVYGRMHWICVLNPSEATFEKIKPLLAEAYEFDVVRTQKKESRKAGLSPEA